MLLDNVLLLNDSRPVSLSVSDGKITGTAVRNVTKKKDGFNIHFLDALAIPGLINSHDHLDFNCFTPLGNRKYKSYTDWGNHIQKAYKENIDAVLCIPQPLRARWGMYKNLLSGITTVVNHGKVLKIENPVITIYQEPQSLHSVKFQKKWKWKLNNPFLQNKTCVIHTGEGVDEQSYDEIQELLKYNFLKRKLVGVHGVAMSPAQAEKFRGLVWCPESNRVLLDKHADIAALKGNTCLVLGTDSTLTGNWNVWQHLRLARTLQKVEDAELFSMITSHPAKLWGLNTGELLPGKDADIVIVKNKRGHADWDDLFAVNPEDVLMVVHKGEIRLFDQTLLSQISSKLVDLNRFNPVSVNGVIKFAEGNLPALIASIRKYNPHIVFPLGNSIICKHSGDD